MNHSPYGDYNDPAYNITQVPAWKSPPVAEDGRAPSAGLSPRAKAAIGAGAVVLAASGMFAVSNYESAQADANVREAQIAVDAARVTLAQEQQAAAQAKAAAQETPVQRARRLAVQACVAKAGDSYGAISDCGKVYPVTDTPAMGDTSSTVNSASSGSGSEVGLVVMGSIGVVLVGGWVKKRLPARS
ncbi:hypothetical protein [Streptacidiphilus sp. PAMC 29251]